MTPEQMMASMNAPQTDTSAPETQTSGMTPQRMQQIIGVAPNLTSGQSAALLGHSTGMFQSLMQGAGDIASGAGAQINETLSNVSKPLTSAVDKLITSPALDQESQQLQQETKNMQTESLGARIGSAGASIGEFMAPGGAETGLAEKVAPYIDKLPEVLGIGGRTATMITGALKTALRGLTGSASIGTVSGAQTGTAEGAKTGAEVGLGAGVLGGLLETIGPSIGRALQKSGFKLSPSQESRAAAKVDQAAKFMTENKILGSDQTKYLKLNTITDSFEEGLQRSLPNTLGISKDMIVKNIDESIESLKTSDPAIYQSAKNDADKAISLLQSTNPDTDIVDVQQVLASKRSYGKAAFKQSKFQVKDPNVVSEGSYAVEQGFQKALEDSLTDSNVKIQVPAKLSQMFGDASEVPLSDYNKLYSQAITSRNLMGLARFKKDTGLVGRFFGLWVGGTLGQTIMPGLGGKIGGATLGEIAAEKSGSLFRRAVQRGVASPEFPERAAKVGMGINNTAQ